MNRRGAWIAIAGVAALAGITTVISRNRIRQPAPFNHKKHVDFGIACAACHAGTGVSMKATIPNVEVCGLCHRPGKSDPKTPPGLLSYIQKNEEIPWAALYRLPSHVWFSHHRHVEIAGLDCVTCHGEIGKTEQPLTRRPVPLKMERCLDCHRREKVTTDCLACHR